MLKQNSLNIFIDVTHYWKIAIDIINSNVGDIVFSVKKTPKMYNYVKIKYGSMYLNTTCSVKHYCREMAGLESIERNVIGDEEAKLCNRYSSGGLDISEGRDGNC